MIQKKNSKILIINKSYMKLYIKQRYLILWSVEKNSENKNPKLTEKGNGKIMFSSNCAVCGSKKVRFIKDQEASGILFGPSSPFSKIPVLGTLL